VHVDAEAVRRLPQFRAKDHGHVPEVREAGLQGDGLQRQIGAGEQALGPLDVGPSDLLAQTLNNFRVGRIRSCPRRFFTPSPESISA
jgi:hypothetical protein